MCCVYDQKKNPKLCNYLISKSNIADKKVLWENVTDEKYMIKIQSILP